jgi:hypothetical protein
MTKPISNVAFRRMIEDLPLEEKKEVISRQMRVLPQMIMDETAKLPPQYNPKVVKFLEKRYMTVCKLWTKVYG